MKVEDAHKVNELFRQIDVLSAENRALKESVPSHSDKTVLARLDDLEALIKEVSCKCDGSSKKSSTK